MSIFRAEVNPSGEIYHICEIMSDDVDAPGIAIEGEALAREILTNLDAYRETNYYDHLTEQFLDRPEITATIDETEIAADNIDTATISGLPIPCTATLDGVDTIITDGVIPFKIDFPGTYEIVITQFPYIPKTFTVVAI